MSQRCPICKARLWSNPWFVRGTLRCPRCGAVFRAAVPWTLFRSLTIVVVVVLLVAALALVRARLSVPLLIVALGLLFYFLPRVIDLERIPGNLRLEGPEGAQLRLKLEEEEEGPGAEGLHSGPFWYWLLAGALLVLLLLHFWRG